MLGTSHSRAAPIACWSLSRSLLVILLLFYLVSPAASFLLDLDVSLASPSLVYTPFVCNATEVLLDPDVCQGGWQMAVDSANNVTVSATGSSKPILAQMFFRFRASSIYITSSPDSNATADVIVAWDSIMRTSTFDSSLGFIGVMDLPYNSTFLLTLTVNPSSTPSLFRLTSVKVAVPPDAIISSVLPSPVTPSSAISPTSFTSQTANPNVSATITSSSQNNTNLSRRTIKLAIGLTVGLGLGLPLIVAIMYALFRWRRRSEPKEGRWSFVT